MAAVDWTTVRRSLLGDRDPSILPPRVKLPVLPTALLEFNKKADDPNASPAMLGKIIETDSGLSCELLRYVNSSAVGLRNKVGTAQMAISVLGIRQTKLLLLSVGVQQAMKSCKSKLINFARFWQTNLERALFAREVARQMKANADLAFAGSMLHDFLLPVISTELYDNYFAFTQLPPETRGSLDTYERAKVGWDHCQATAQVMLNWGFPDDLLCCVLLHHGGLGVMDDAMLGNSAVAAVAAAALLPDQLGQSGEDWTTLQSLQQRWPSFDLATVATSIAQQVREMGIPIDESWLLATRVEKLMAATTN